MSSLWTAASWTWSRSRTTEGGSGRRVQTCHLRCQCDLGSVVPKEVLCVPTAFTVLVEASVWRRVFRRCRVNQERAQAVVRVSPLGKACVRGGHRALFSCSEHGLGRRRPEPSADAAIPCPASLPPVFLPAVWSGAEPRGRRLALFGRGGRAGPGASGRAVRTAVLEASILWLQ